MKTRITLEKNLGTGKRLDEVSYVARVNGQKIVEVRTPEQCCSYVNVVVSALIAAGTLAEDIVVLDQTDAPRMSAANPA